MYNNLGHFLAYPFLKPLKVLYPKENILLKYHWSRTNSSLTESKIGKVPFDEDTIYLGFEEKEDLILINGYLNENVITISNNGRFGRTPKR